MMEIRASIYTKDGRIDCEVKHPKLGWIPYTASEHDVHPFGRSVFAAAKAAGPAEHVPPPPPSNEEVAIAVRSERDSMLRVEVDPVVSNPLRWADMSVEQQQAWSDYRRALLDVPQQSGFPRDVTWPTKPE